MKEFDLEKFVNNTWEKKPDLLENFKFEESLDHISNSFFDNFFSTKLLHSSEVKLSKNGEYISSENYCYGKILSGDVVNHYADLKKMMSYFENGASIILPSVQNHFNEVKRTCIELERKLNHSVTANLYITPKNAQGFSAHYDSHDVFVLQLLGTKKWVISQSKAMLPISNSKRPDVGELIFNKVLSKEDVLYIPRGVVHEVSTLDEMSIHITYSVTPKRVISIAKDVVADLLENIAVSNPEVRKTIPVVPKVSLVEDVKKEVMDIISTLNSPEMVTLYLENYFLKNETNRNYELNGHFKTITDIDNIDISTSLQFRRDLPFKIKQSEGSWTICFKNRFLKFDYKLFEIFKELMSSSEFKVEDLNHGDLSSSDILSFVKVLIKNCFIYKKG
mgnify:CR=1 FL=1